MFHQFQDDARKAMALANVEAQRLNHEYICSEHILLGLVLEGSGIGCRVLKDWGVDAPAVRAGLEKLAPGGLGKLHEADAMHSQRAKKVIEYAIIEARMLNHDAVGSEHLLLGLLREQDSLAAQVLSSLNVDLDQVRDGVLKLVADAAPSPGAGTQERRQWEYRVEDIRAESLADAQQMLNDYGRDGWEGVNIQVLETADAEVIAYRVVLKRPIARA